MSDNSPAKSRPSDLPRGGSKSTLRVRCPQPIPDTPKNVAKPIFRKLRRRTGSIPKVQETR